MLAAVSFLRGIRACYRIRYRNVADLPCSKAYAGAHKAVLHPMTPYARVNALVDRDRVLGHEWPILRPYKGLLPRVLPHRARITRTVSAHVAHDRQVFLRVGVDGGLYNPYSEAMKTLTPTAAVNLANTTAGIVVNEIAKNPVRAEAVLMTIRRGLDARLPTEQAAIVMKAVLVMVENRLVAAGMKPTAGKIGTLATAMRLAANA
jgi:hypothetical protein